MSMITLNTINKRIAQTKECIESLKGLERSPILEFQIKQFEDRLNSLIHQKEEIESSQSKEQISLRIYGENVAIGKVSNRVLVSMLGGFQDIVDNISNVIVGADASRGQIKDTAKKIGDFEVCGTFAGSFGVILEKEYEQIEVSSEMYETDKVLREFFDILEYSDGGEELISRIAPFGQRTVRHYREWLNQMKENSVNLEVNWKNEESEFRKMDLKYSKASDIIFTLDSIGEIKDEDVIVNAVLTGVNIRKCTFELNTEDKCIIKGKSTPEVLITAAGKIGNEVSAKLVKSTCSLYTGALKESWFLSQILG